MQDVQVHDKILVVDDEPRVVRLVTEVLRAVGYTVVAAGNGQSALQNAALEQPALILLDVLLPGGMDGYEICRRLREFSTVPVIMLTAKATEADLLRGFEAGADDYLTKPFSAKELVARVKAVLRRSERPDEIVTQTLTCGQIEVNLARHTVQVDGKEVSLTRTEFALLKQLALHMDCVVPHEDLLTAVWGSEYRNDIDYLRAYIRYLRRKLEADPTDPQYIVTSAGVGYMMRCPQDQT